MTDLEKMKNTMPQTGKIVWIGLRAEKRSELIPVELAEVTEETGLIGDHYSGRSGERQVTLIQAEHLEGVAKILGKEKLNPALTRRNIMVEGVNLLAFYEREFQIGDEVILKMTGHCHPCSKMEKNLGAGGYNAMRGHGGITAKVVKGGTIKSGDEVKLNLS